MPPREMSNGLSRVFKYILYAAVVFFVLTLIAFLLWKVAQPKSDMVQEVVETQVEELSMLDLPSQILAEGKILLTLQPKDTRLPGIYSYDVSTRKLEPLFAPQGVVGLTASFQGADVLLATDYTMATSERGNAMFDIAALSAGNNSPVRIATDPNAYKRHPVWSESLKAVVYSAKSSPTTPMSESSTNDFRIFLNKDGRDTEIGEGAMPKLLPDGRSVLVMRRTGLYSLNLETKEATSVWPISSGSAWFNMQFDVSRDGKYIAWSSPHEGKILIMHVISWAPFKGTVTREIRAHAFWPVFSPDARYLAFEEVDWGEKKPTKPRLVLYSPEGDFKETVLDLDGFVQEAMFVTDWR